MALNFSDITFAWQFNPLFTCPTSSGYNDVVTKVFYQLRATIGPVSGSAGGYQEILPVSPSGSFIPFKDLTSPVVQQWVEYMLGEEGVTNIKTELAEKLEYKLNPPVVIKQSPWILP